MQRNASGVRLKRNSFFFDIIRFVTVVVFLTAGIRKKNVYSCVTMCKENIDSSCRILYIGA